MRYIALLVIVLIFSLSPTTAQHQTENPVITPINLDQVRELQRIGRGVVVDAQYSPTGEQIAVTSSIGIWLYDTSDLSAEPRLLEGHDEWMAQVAYSPDGLYLVAYANDPATPPSDIAFVWDAQTGDLLHQLRENEYQYGVTDIGFLSDSTTLFTEGVDDQIRLWDAPSGTFLGFADEKPSVIAPTMVSPDRAYQLNSLDDRVDVIEVATDTVLYSLTGYNTGYILAEFSHQTPQSIVALPYNPLTSRGDNTLHILDAMSGQLIHTLYGHTEAITSLDISPDGTQIASASEDNTIRLWDTVTGDFIMLLSGHTDIVNNVSYSPSGRYMISASFDTTVRVWDALTGEHSYTLDLEELVVDAGFSADEQFIVTSEIDAYYNTVGVTIWNATTKRIISGYFHQVYGLSFHPTLPMFVKYNRDNFGFFWLLRRSTGHHLTYELSGRYNDANFSPNGLIVVGAGVFRHITLQTILPQEPITLTGHLAQIQSANFSPDGRYILTSSTDGTLRIWGVPAS